VVDWPKRREVLSRGGNAYARLMLRLPVRDATGGFRVYRRAVLEAIELGDVASAGYCFQVDLLWRAWRAGFRVVEVPIRFVERVAGVSKMDRNVVAEALWLITVWGLSDRRKPRRRNPRTEPAPPSTSGGA
jgi:dolichol-phosphate mannosyltransferase